MPGGNLDKVTLTLRMAPKSAQGMWVPCGPETILTLQGGATVPKRRFKKDLIRAGTYVKDVDNLVFHVGPEHLGNWVVQFQRMKSNGVKVPIPTGHKSAKWEKTVQVTGDPRENMGWVEEMWVEGDTLWMMCNLIGQDALVAARRSDVSLNSPPQFVDGKGRLYARPITHVAMVTDPVVPGLGDFVPLAASRSKTLRLQESRTMLEFLQKLGAAVGLDPASLIDEATAMQLVMERIEALMAQVQGQAVDSQADAGQPTKIGSVPGALPGQPGGPGLSQPAGAVREEVTKRTFAASQAAKQPDPPHPLMVKTVAENRQLKLQSLVDSGRITPDQHEKLVGGWCSDDVVTLALSSGADGSDFDQMMEILTLNPEPIKTGEQTGAQTLSLSDPNKAANKPTKSPLVVDAEARAAARKTA